MSKTIATQSQINKIARACVESLNVAEPLKYVSSYTRTPIVTLAVTKQLLSDAGLRLAEAGELRDAISAEHRAALTEINQSMPAIEKTLGKAFADASKAEITAAIKSVGVRATLIRLVIARATAHEIEIRVAQSIRKAFADARKAFIAAGNDERFLKSDDASVTAAIKASVEPKHHKRAAAAIAQLINARRDQFVIDTFKSNYRSCINGEITVAHASNPESVGLTQTEHTDWDLYKGAYKNWAAKIVNTKLTLPADWLSRVYAKGLAVIDGMMTIDASPLPAPEGCQLYAATWIVQGRGNHVESVSGFIAISSNISYHADTAINAIRGVSRKAKVAAQVAQWEEMLSAESLESLSGKLPEGAVVTLDDARNIGACEYGIKSWCHATNLPYAQGCAPIVDVIAAYRSQPRVEARAAILHAVRQARKRAQKSA